MIIATALLGAMTANAVAQERFPKLTLEQMTPEQRKVAEAIMNGPRGGPNGPFNAWLRSPETGDRLQRVGEQMRFHSSIPPALNEFAILITARQWDAQCEWYAHHSLAMKAGLPEKVAAEVAQGPPARGDEHRRGAGR